MTFIIGLTVEVPTVYWEDLGTFGIAITAPVPTAGFGAAGKVALTSPSTELSVAFRSVDFDISLTSPSPVPAIHSRDLALMSIGLMVPDAVPRVHSYTEIHGSIALEAFQPALRWSGAPGTILSIELIPPVAAPSWTDALAHRWSLAITAPVASPAIHGLMSITTMFRRAIVMNASKYSVTHYENYPFNSVAEFNGMLIGANSDGVYLLGGDDDLGSQINSEITSGLTDFSYQAVRKALEAWITSRSNGEMELTVRVDEMDDPYAYAFEKFPSRLESRAKPGKGIKGRFLTFGIRNKDGSTFDLQTFRILGDTKGLKTR